MDGKPRRGDQVEEFMLRHRDRYPAVGAGPEGAVFDAIDDMLDRYRALADLGYSLDEEERLV